MREKFFRFLLTKLEKRSPGRLQSIQIQILLNVTARAFERPGRMVWHLPLEKALAAYAQYTRHILSSASQIPKQQNSHPAAICPYRPSYMRKKCISGPAPDRKRIYRCAYQLGRRIRQISGFTKREDIERLVFYLYSSIGIKMTGHLPGEITIPLCYFGNIYTADQCMTMSLMDWGIISGICGEGKLVFTERITQGCGRCRAVLQKEV